AFLIHKIHYIRPIVAFLAFSAVIADSHILVFIYFFNHKLLTSLSFFFVYPSTFATYCPVFELCHAPITPEALGNIVNRLCWFSGYVSYLSIVIHLPFF